MCKWSRCYREKEIADNLNLDFSAVGKELAKMFSTHNNTGYLKYLTKVNKEIIVF